MKHLLNSAGLSISSFLAPIILVLVINLGILMPLANFFTLKTLTETIERVPIDKILGSNEDADIYKYLSKIGLSKDKIYTFLDKLKFKKILGENLGSKILNKINNFKIVLPLEEDITDFIYENLEYVKKLFILKTTKDDVREFVHQNYEKITGLLDNLTDSFDLSSFDNLKTIVHLIRMSSVYLTLAGIVILLLLLLVFRASIIKWLMWVSTISFLVGMLYLVGGTFGNNLIATLVSKLNILFLVEPFVTYFTDSMIKYGTILMIISLFSLGTHFSLKKHKENKQRNNQEFEKKLNENFN